MVAMAFVLGLISPMAAQQDETIYRPGNGVSTPRLIRNVNPH